MSSCRSKWPFLSRAPIVTLARGANNQMPIPHRSNVSINPQSLYIKRFSSQLSWGYVKISCDEPTYLHILYIYRYNNNYYNNNDNNNNYKYIYIYTYIYVYTYICKWGLYGDTAYINPAIFQGTIRQRTVGSSAHFKENKPHLRCSH